MNTASQIEQGKTSLGIEFGSTRIKAVLTGESYMPIAIGTYDWENHYENGIWTYSLREVREGLKGCFADLSKNVKKQYGVVLRTTASMGISAMMHGYLAFDKNGELLVPFRTWRNTITEEAASILTDEFSFNIPQRWSIAHLYQAILNKEPHVKNIAFITTLAGYVHWLLTGEKVLGIGDASGVFPIDSALKDYNPIMKEKFNRLSQDINIEWNLDEILPEIIPVGECAGYLTEEGAGMLDSEGNFKAGIAFCPPEGDAGTGMVATNSIKPKTGNVSAGTSIFAMAVLEHELKSVHKEIDMVTTPCGNPVAMVHCNNCSTDIDAWVKMFGEAFKMFGFEVSKPQLYEKLFAEALSETADTNGIISYNYYSGEHVTGFQSGMPMLIHVPDSDFTVASLMKSLIYSSMSTLKIGMDILLKKEGIKLDKITAHGGLFKSPITGQRFLSAALETPVSLLKSAGEGGAWGIALLAAYQARNDKAETLADFLENRVFTDLKGNFMEPEENDIKNFSSYIEEYKKNLEVEKRAVMLNSEKNTANN